MATKEQFLSKLASKLNRERAYQVERPRWERHPWDHLYPDASQADFVELFAEEFGKLGGEVVRVRSKTQVGEAVKKLLQDKGLKKLIAWPAPSAFDGAEPTVLLSPAEGYEVVHWRENGPREELIRTAEQSEAGLVYASYALAETGSVVLFNRGSQGRLVSLLPNQSVIVLKASSVLPRLTQALPIIGREAELFSCVNIVTGPSRTSDIEMDLTIGVHGPGRVAVVLIEDHLSGL